MAYERHIGTGQAAMVVLTYPSGASYVAHRFEWRTVLPSSCPTEEGRIVGDAPAYDYWMPRPLPPDFIWFTPTWDRQARSLRVGHEWGLEVAYVNMRADGITWLSVVNRHRGPGLRRHAVARSCVTAMRWASCWAAARADRLRDIAIEREEPKGKWVAFKPGGGCKNRVGDAISAVGVAPTPD